MGWVNGWRRRIAMAGTFVVLGAALVLPGTFATGEVGTGEGPFGTAGTLRLHTGAQDYFRFDPTDGSDPTLTTISATNCKASLSNASLVALSQTPTTAGSAVGFNGDGLGVKVLGEGNGVPCGQVNGTGQSITIALAGILAGRAAYFADLDAEFKFTGTQIKADMYLGGVHQGAMTFDCTGANPKDCGKDSAAGDNYRLKITGFVFDAIKLSTPTPGGAFSLKGGSDGNAETTFQISGAEGTLNCGETVTETGDPGEPSATVQRLNNTGCQKILYTLESSSDADSQDVKFLKDVSSQPDASFFATVYWALEPADYPLQSLVRVNEGSGPYTPEWCDGTFASPTLPATAVFNGQHWCVRKESTESAGAGQVASTTYFFGFGDPIFDKVLGSLG